jgi:hypothetical protein
VDKSPAARTIVAIIGAGPAGLATARYLYAAGFAPVLFDQSDGVGGQWRVSGGYSSMWSGMHTNTTRITTAFSDMPHPPGTPAYPCAEAIGDYLEQYADRFALRLCLHKLEYQVVYAVLLLHELLLKQGWTDLELVQGYLTVAGETCWHCWLVHGGAVVDLLRILATRKDPAFARCEYTYTTETPSENVQEDPANLEIWANRNEKTLWRNAPKKFQEFRSLMHKKLR